MNRFGITLLLALSLICLINCHYKVTGRHKPHYNTWNEYSDNFTKEEVEKILNIEYLIDGDKKTFGEINDVIDLKVHGIFVRGKKVVTENDREVHIVVGQPDHFYCYNILAPYLSKGQKLRITCPNNLPAGRKQKAVGTHPHKPINLEIEVLSISKAWKKKEVEEIFKVEYLNKGMDWIHPRLGDLIYFHYVMYNAKTGERVFTTERGIYNERETTLRFTYNVGDHWAPECFEIVIPLLHQGQKAKFLCPKKYLWSEKNNKAEFDFDVIVECKLESIHKNYQEDHKEHFAYLHDEL